MKAISALLALALSGCCLPPRYRVRGVSIHAIAPADLVAIREADAEAQAAARAIVWAPTFGTP